MDCAAELKAAHQLNSELNEQLRAVRLELAAEINRRRLVEAQKVALEGRLRAETRKPGYGRTYQEG